MDQPFAHPAGEKLLSEVRQLFKNKPVFHRRDKPLVFLCGGSTKAQSKKLRRKFLLWAKDRFQEVVFVLAEEAYRYTNSYDPPEAVNLSEFEKVIAEIADCVIVFPESAGSFAELGFFSGHKDICKKTLVVNIASRVPEESFINLGPIATINEKSFLRPALPITIRNGQYNFSQVRNRLQRVIRRDRRKSFTYKPYRALKLFEKFLVILEMIYLFQFVTLDDVEKCLFWIFEGAVRKDMWPLLSVLLGMDFICLREGYYLIAPHGKSFLEFEDSSTEDLRLRVLGHYEKNFPRIWRRFQRVKS